LSDDIAGFNAFAVDAHIRAAFAPAADSFIGTDDHKQVVRIVLRTKGNNKGLFQWYAKLIQLNGSNV